MFEPLRKALLAGFGAREKVGELIDDFVKAGELSESQGAKLVKEWSEKAEKSSEEVNKLVADTVAKAMKKFKFPTKDDITKLNKRLNTLTKRLDSIEGDTGDKGQQ